jgi:Protein of unknown function (DUF3024)
MPMNDIERKRVENTVAAFIAKRRPPAHMRDQLDLGFRFDGQVLEIFTTRPRWNDPSERSEQAIARARYWKSRNEWSIYWERADMKWHRYQPVPNVPTVAAFLRVVDEDEYGCFFG